MIRNNNSYRSFIINFLRILLGILFVMSGSIKLFDLKSFFLTIKSLIPFLSSYSNFIGVFVILSELFLGFMLLFQKKIRIAVSLLLAIVFIFICLLVYNILMGTAVGCNCFGFISGYYSLNTQLIIDIILLNNLIILYYLLNNRITIATLKSNKANWIVATIFYMLINFNLLQLAISGNEKKEKISENILPKISSVISRDKLNQKNTEVFFFISFNDFSCPLCYDSFISVSDSLNKINNNIAIIYLFEKTSMGYSLQQENRFKEWLKTVGIKKPAYAISDSLFRDITNKSCIIIFNKNNELVIKEIFPVDPLKQKIIYNYLNTN